MKKKTYIKLETRVISISSSNILAGSGGGVEKNDNVTTEDQYSKENTEKGLWDE